MNNNKEIQLTHRELCLKGARYLRYKGIQYVVCELERIGESPDIFGWGGSCTQLIEVKISHSDFLNDRKKYWRKNPVYGIGRYRSYLCNIGLIKKTELPEKWGLLYINEKGKIIEIVKPEIQDCNHIEELNLITSILRREKIKPQIFNYKIYINNSNINHY